MIPTAVDTPGKNVQDAIIATGHWAVYESWVMYAVLQEHQLATVVDVGSNTGYFSFLAAALGAKHVMSIEPNTVHNEVFTQTLKLAQFEATRIDLVNAFISDKNSVLFDGWTGMTALHENGKKCTMMSASRLEKLWPNGATFVKVEVEGVELDVFSSSEPLLSMGKFPYVMFEVTYVRDDDSAEKIVDMLRSIEFEIYTIGDRMMKLTDFRAFHNQFYQLLENKPEMRSCGCNLLAIHSSARVPKLLQFNSTVPKIRRRRRLDY